MMDYIKDNLDEINQRIKRAARKSGRDIADITLVGVTKTIDVARIQRMIDFGVKNIGENRVQEIMAKYDSITDANWHMIGHLQTNKVKYIADKVSMIHSVDSFKLGQEISKRALEAGRVIDVLIEVNIAAEDTKYGVSPDGVYNLVKDLSILDGITVSGLMCVAPFVENPEENREYFKKMRQLAVDIKSKMVNNISIKYLSMGMTNDFDVAIEEGANIIRIGTGIFGDRNP